MFKLSFIDPAMFCPCLSCHSLTLLCTVHVYVVIHWTYWCTVHVYVVIHLPCHVLSMFMLSFIDIAMYCPCLCCHSLILLCTVHVYVVIHWPCYCTVHVYVVIHWSCYVLSMFMLSFIDPAIVLSMFMLLFILVINMWSF